MRTHCPWYAGCTPLMDLVIPSMGPGALLSTGLMRCPPTGRVRCGPGALLPTGRVRCPGCAGCVIPDVLGSLPLAYPPQALTCRLHSPWHARRIAVIGWPHCPDMRKQPFEMYRMVSKGGFRTEMALVMCFINGLKRARCFQTADFAHRRVDAFGSGADTEQQQRRDSRNHGMRTERNRPKRSCRGSASAFRM